MNKLDKKLDRILYNMDLPATGKLINVQEWQKNQIKSVILEALKAEWPEELELIEGREQFTSAFNGCRYDCLNVCNKLLGDSNAE